MYAIHTLNNLNIGYIQTAKHADEATGLLLDSIAVIYMVKVCC